MKATRVESIETFDRIRCEENRMIAEHLSIRMSFVKIN